MVRDTDASRGARPVHAGGRAVGAPTSRSCRGGGNDLGDRLRDLAPAWRGSAPAPTTRGRAPHGRSRTSAVHSLRRGAGRAEMGIGLTPPGDRRSTWRSGVARRCGSCCWLCSWLSPRRVPARARAPAGCTTSRSASRFGLGALTRTRGRRSHRAGAVRTCVAADRDDPRPRHQDVLSRRSTARTDRRRRQAPRRARSDPRQRCPARGPPRAGLPERVQRAGAGLLPPRRPRRAGARRRP